MSYLVEVNHRLNLATLLFCKRPVKGWPQWQGWRLWMHLTTWAPFHRGWSNNSQQLANQAAAGSSTETLVRESSQSPGCGSVTSIPLQLGEGNDSSLLELFSSVQSVMSNSWRPHGLQHARPPCLSPTHEFTQIHVHWVSDAIQLSHPLSPPSLPTFNLSQHRGLFKWVSFSHQVAKVLEFQLQH